MDKFEKELNEAFSGLGKVTGKNRWVARIIKEGAGGSGVYTGAALATVPLAFPAGTKVNFDHPTESEVWDRPAGSVTTLAGVLVTDPVVQNGESFAEIEFSQEAAGFVEQFHEVLGLSIHASGYGSEYTDSGMLIVEGFIPSPLNTVDLVTVAGAGGKLLRLTESYRETRDKIDTNESITPIGRNDGMTPDEIKALLAGFKDELLKELRPEPVVEEGPATSDISEALIAANLPKSARDKVYAAVQGGVKLEEAIKSEQDYIKELSEAIATDTKPDQGIVGGTGNGYDFTVGGWA